MAKLIIANWKMHPATEAEAVRLAKDVQAENFVIAPPFIFLEAVRGVITKGTLGAQDIAAEDKGSFTGEVSGSQLFALGVRYVIVGHSERRHKLGETDEMIARKVAAAVKNSLTPILCVGETKAEREEGKTRDVIGREFEQGLSLLKKGARSKSPRLVIAYEPVWAISTEKNAIPDTPENAVRAIQFLKRRFGELRLSAQASFIYGGSVTAANADAFLKEKEIEGALVGGASLKKEEIKKIVEIAKKYEG